MKIFGTSRFTASLLATALLAGSLSGCGSGETASGSAPASSAAGTSSAAAPADPAPASAEANKEIVTLKMLGLNEKIDPMTELERDRIREFLGYDIQGEIGADAEKVSLILSSGQEYDIIKYNDKTVLSQIIANKSVQPLSDAIDQYGPNLQSTIPERVWKMTAGADGQVYALLNTQYEAVADLLAVRSDWLAALGMEAPNTADEFYNMLKAFKEQNPLGVANPIPFTFNRGLKIIGLTEAFGTASSPIGFIDVGGELQHGFELPGTKDYLLFLRKLYKEGLLDADFAVNTYATYEEKIGSGNVGCAAMSCWNSNAQKAVNQLGPDAKMTFIKPLAGKDGNRQVLTTGGMETFIVVPNASKKRDEVVKFANAFLDPENYQKLIIGDEGVHWEEQDGVKKPIMPAFNDLNMARWFFPVNEASIYTPIFGVRAWKTPEMGSMWEETTSLGGEYGYLDPLAYAPAMPEVMAIEKKIADYASEQMINFIIDDTIPESEYDNIVSTYLSMGGEQYIKAYRDWYATQKTN